MEYTKVYPFSPEQMTVVASLDTGEFGATVWFRACRGDATLQLHLESWIPGHEDMIFALQRKMEKVEEIDRDEHGCSVVKYFLAEDSR